ncbi:hypothetical protein H9P43_002676 [Blastocladiella emersonii ATCC 22665]|nr:hypothetical protein H9P43_002676 [Blastocladiella emersonii ATCC 22665]
MITASVVALIALRQRAVANGAKPVNVKGMLRKLSTMSFKGSSSSSRRSSADVAALISRHDLDALIAQAPEAPVPSVYLRQVLKAIATSAPDVKPALYLQHLVRDDATLALLVQDAAALNVLCECVSCLLDTQDPRALVVLAGILAAAAGHSPCPVAAAAALHDLPGQVLARVRVTLAQESGPDNTTVFLSLLALAAGLFSPAVDPVATPLFASLDVADTARLALALLVAAPDLGDGDLAAAASELGLSLLVAGCLGERSFVRHVEAPDADVLAAVISTVQPGPPSDLSLLALGSLISASPVLATRAVDCAALKAALASPHAFSTPTTGLPLLRFALAFPVTEAVRAQLRGTSATAFAYDQLLEPNGCTLALDFLLAFEAPRDRLVQRLVDLCLMLGQLDDAACGAPAAALVRVLAHFAAQVPPRVAGDVFRRLVGDGDLLALLHRFVESGQQLDDAFSPLGLVLAAIIDAEPTAVAAVAEDVYGPVLTRLASRLGDLVEQVRAVIAASRSGVLDHDAAAAAVTLAHAALADASLVTDHLSTTALSALWADPAHRANLHAAVAAAVALVDLFARDSHGNVFDLVHVPRALQRYCAAHAAGVSEAAEEFLADVNLAEKSGLGAAVLALVIRVVCPLAQYDETWPSVAAHRTSLNLATARFMDPVGIPGYLAVRARFEGESAAAGAGGDLASLAAAEADELLANYFLAGSTGPVSAIEAASLRYLATAVATCGRAQVAAARARWVPDDAARLLVGGAGTELVNVSRTTQWARASSCEVSGTGRYAFTVHLTRETRGVCVGWAQSTPDGDAALLDLVAGTASFRGTTRTFPGIAHLPATVAVFIDPDAGEVGFHAPGRAASTVVVSGLNAAYPWTPVVRHPPRTAVRVELDAAVPAEYLPATGAGAQPSEPFGAITYTPVPPPAESADPQRPASLSRTTLAYTARFTPSPLGLAAVGWRLGTAHVLLVLAYGVQCVVTIDSPDLATHTAWTLDLPALAAALLAKRRFLPRSALVFAYAEAAGWTISAFPPGTTTAAAGDAYSDMTLVDAAVSECPPDVVEPAATTPVVVHAGLSEADEPGVYQFTVTHGPAEDVAGAGAAVVTQAWNVVVPRRDEGRCWVPVVMGAEAVAVTAHGE